MFLSMLINYLCVKIVVLALEHTLAIHTLFVRIYTHCIRIDTLYVRISRIPQLTVLIAV